MSRDVDLSVVVAASWSAEAAARTVASVGARDGIETVVASDPDRVGPIDLPGESRWVFGERGDEVPRLRRVGADAARGRVIAFVEDACVVVPGWAGAILGAFAEGDCLAATGPVLQADGASATDWAVYFAEYAAFVGAVPCKRLAGINFACRREWLGPSMVIREAELSTRFAGSIRWLDAAPVHHTRRYRFAEALSDRWHFGRTYGRDRWSDRHGPLRRLGRAAAPAILAIQLARLAGSIARNPRLIQPALASVPRTLALLTAWSAGEALGWAEAGLHPSASRRRGREVQPPASALAPAATE
jgi:hypothetical protein